MGVAGYYAYGGEAFPNIVKNLSHGPIRITVEICLLLHLVAAFPIILNPPFQYFEHILNIPSNFNWKRCFFRTTSVFVLLFIAETIPSFGSILDLVGASTVTLLNFVFPPYFYMKLCDSSIENKEWEQRFVVFQLVMITKTIDYNLIFQFKTSRGCDSPFLIISPIHISENCPFGSEFFAGF